MPTASGEKESNLQLTGNKIKLVTRPLDNQSTASSRCALLGKNTPRPFSAVPLLNLNFNEFDVRPKTKRPLSADFPQGNRSLFFSDRKMIKDRYEEDGTTSLESSEELENALPSTNLLQDLLAEPIYSWRNGIRLKPPRKNKTLKKLAVSNRDNNETPSAGSDTSSSAENLAVKSQESSKRSKIEKPPESYSMALIPGLKTKPPLPKKAESTLNTYRTKTPHLESFDIISNAMMEPNLPPEKLDNVESATTLDAELKFQNWVQDDQNRTHEIAESELNTDLSLETLKAQQKGFSKDLDADKQTQSKPPNEIFQKRNVEPIKHKENLSKAVNFDFVDLKEYERKKIHSKNFIKHNIKLSSKKTSKKASEECSPKSKSEAAVVRNSQSDSTHEIESWMSEFEKAKNCEKNSPYLDCLEKIEELQEDCKEFCLGDLPQQDVELSSTDLSDANTYDDIVQILQTLEEEDKRSQIKMESMKQIVIDELSSGDNLKNRNVFSEVASAKTHNEMLQESLLPKQLYFNDLREQELPTRGSINSPNLSSIFSFLDEVDKSCSKTLATAKERINSANQAIENTLNLDTIPKLEELLAYTNAELSTLVIDLNLRLKDKSSSISLLQKELSSLREQITKMTKDGNEIVKQRLKTQKEDYENVVKRHQKFIDQLINDKKTLNQQCESLIHEMKVIEDRFNSNLKAAEHRHQVELHKVKEMQAAGEKMRRERWVDSKTQKIKELTIKGLEPELDKMAARHQQELTDLRALHKREIEDLELRSARKLQQHCEALRDQLIAEREKALLQEREVLKQRYEQLVQSEEQNYQEQRRRLLAEHSQRVSELEQRENDVVNERDKAIKQAYCDFEDKLQAATRRHNTELNLLKEKAEIEMETFRNNYKKQVALQLAEKEIEIKEKYRRERDREIEAVIERLEMESNEIKAQMEQSTENRIRRHKEKYEKEIQDLETSEKESVTKYTETKSKLLQTDDVVISLKTTIKHLETQLKESKELSEKLTTERNKLKDIVREEMGQELHILEKEITILKTDKDKELQQVYARVKLAVARKDETISELSRDHSALQEKCVYLENMLEQQRKEYLIK